MLHLIIDIGNTRSKLAFFKGRKQLGRLKIVDKLTVAFLKKFTAKRDISAVAVSIVGKVPVAAIKWLEKSYPFVNLDHKTSIPINNAYKTPATLGKDRLAAAIGAYAIFPGKPVLIFDAGTCITYDLVDAQGKYHGGAISPGMKMRFQAMDEFTANLPLAKFKANTVYLGRNTDESLRAGAQWGLINEIEGFIRQYRKQFKGLKILATGGDSTYLAKKLKSKIFVHPNLVLEGLNEILIHNK